MLAQAVRPLEFPLGGGSEKIEDLEPAAFRVRRRLCHHEMPVADGSVGGIVADLGGVQSVAVFHGEQASDALPCDRRQWGA